jgi:hypothetical protein
MTKRGCDASDALSGGDGGGNRSSKARNTKKGCGDAMRCGAGMVMMQVRMYLRAVCLVRAMADGVVVVVMDSCNGNVVVEAGEWSCVGG